jgi:hypothetical protein
MVKWASRVRVDPTLREVNPFLYCGSSQSENKYALTQKGVYVENMLSAAMTAAGGLSSRSTAAIMPVPIEQRTIP